MQLVHIINGDLNCGIRDARYALRSADVWAIPGPLYCRANKAHAKAVTLVPLVVEITVEERSRIEAKIGYLSEMLQCLSAIGSIPTPAEDEMAAFARAVWKARDCADDLAQDDWFRAERALKTHGQENALAELGRKREQSPASGFLNFCAASGVTFRCPLNGSGTLKTR